MSWHERIAAARERGRFTEDDRELADSWVDCACGEQSDDIPRNQFTGEPKDLLLVKLGRLFQATVSDNYFDEAEYVLENIEARSASLLAEMGVS